MVFSVLAGQQTNSLTGTVIDADDGSTLLGANAMLSGTLHGAATDSEGRFTIIDVPIGDYTLMVTYVGYFNFLKSLF